MPSLFGGGGKIPKPKTAAFPTHPSDTFASPASPVSQIRSELRLAYPAGDGSAAILCSMLPNSRRVRWLDASSKQQPVVPGMFHQPTAEGQLNVLPRESVSCCSMSLLNPRRSSTSRTRIRSPSEVTRASWKSIFQRALNESFEGWFCFSPTRCAPPKRLHHIHARINTDDGGRPQVCRKTLISEIWAQACRDSPLRWRACTPEPAVLYFACRFTGQHWCNLKAARPHGSGGREAVLAMVAHQRGN